LSISSEADRRAREENALKQEAGASILIQSEPIELQARSILISVNGFFAKHHQISAAHAGHLPKRMAAMVR
jgi:hypothetical protein